MKNETRKELFKITRMVDRMKEEKKGNEIFQANENKKQRGNEKERAREMKREREMERCTDGLMYAGERRVAIFACS